MEEVEDGPMIKSPSTKTSGRMGDAILSLRALPYFRWEPGRDTLLTLATMIYMVPSYYLMANDRHQLAGHNFLFASLFVLVLLPAYHVLRARGESLEELGLTKRRWLPSLLISLALVSRLVPRVSGLLSAVPSGLVLPTVIYNGLCFWEPFFVFCWVQLRFERAFGVVPGILVAGLCLGSYHVGTYPWGMVVNLGMVGVFLGALFRLTRNLLVLWPLTWAAASTMGTVSGGFVFGWSTVWIYAAVLIAQVAGIWWIARTRKTLEDPGQQDSGVSELEATRKDMAWRDWVLSCVYGSILVFQVAFTYLNYNRMGLDYLVNAGWLVMTVSAVFGWVPIYTFRKAGGVPKGEGYTQTTILVDSGIYAVVRHPQYFAGILISLALALMSQHWLNVVLVVPVAVGTYLDSLRADERLVEKFGDEYESYMRRVSGLNPLIGIVRLFRTHARENEVAEGV